MSIKYKKNSTTVNDVAYNVPSIPDVDWYDTALSATSTKPLQTRAVKTALDAKLSTVIGVRETEAVNTAIMNDYQSAPSSYYTVSDFNTEVSADLTSLNSNITSMNGTITAQTAKVTDLSDKPEILHYSPTNAFPETVMQKIGTSWQVPGAATPTVTTNIDLYHNVFTLEDNNNPDIITRSFTVAGLGNSSSTIPYGTILKWHVRKGFTTSMTIPDTPRLVINGYECNVRSHNYNGYGSGTPGIMRDNDMGLKWYKINGICVPLGNAIGTTHNGFEMSYNRLVAKGYDNYEMILEPQSTVDKRVLITPGITLTLMWDSGSWWILGNQLICDFKVQYKTAYSGGTWTDCGWFKCYSSGWKEAEYDVRWLTDKYQDTDAVYHMRYLHSFNSERYNMGNFVAVVPIMSSNTAAYTGNSFVQASNTVTGVPAQCNGSNDTIHVSVKVQPSTLDGYRFIIRGV